MFEVIREFMEFSYQSEDYNLYRSTFSEKKEILSEPAQNLLKLSENWKDLVIDTNYILNKITEEAVQKYSSLKSIIYFTKDKKDFHSIAGNVDALSYATAKGEKYWLFLIFQTFLEFLLIDVNDSLDYDHEWSINESEKIYKFSLLNVFSNNKQILKNPYEKIKDFGEDLYQLQNESVDFLRDLLDKHVKLPARVRILCGKVLDGYAFTETVMHEKKLQNIYEYSKVYMQREKSNAIYFSKLLPAFLENDEMIQTWKDAFGSPLGQSAILFSFIFNSSNESTWDELYDFFYAVVPWIHVALDDIGDMCEDIGNKDPNIAVFFSQFSVEKQTVYLDNIAEIFRMKAKKLAKHVDKKIAELQFVKINIMINLYLKIFENFTKLKGFKQIDKSAADSALRLRSTFLNISYFLANFNSDIQKKDRKI